MKLIATFVLSAQLVLAANKLSGICNRVGPRTLSWACQKHGETSVIVQCGINCKAADVAAHNILSCVADDCP
ncbi:hypothetical protein LZ30DRAFT_728038 [Colletotrichum cereale]|nr:hypothetical protein LZ30DRAFT_728038 [Colletotrichum cereale]